MKNAAKFTETIEAVGYVMATGGLSTTLTIGCADNHLAAIGRQCFYLASHPSALSYLFTLLLFAATGSTDPRPNAPRASRLAEKKGQSWR
jgi:hypothetical protein